MEKWNINRRKTLTLTLMVIILVTALAVETVLNIRAEQEAGQEAHGGQEEAAINLYTYPVSPPLGSRKVYVVTVETNWTSQPKVTLPEFDTLKYVSVDFGWSAETVFFNITIPTDLLWGNISLIRKYYIQSPDLYTLSNNGTHNSIWMTCVFTPYFSGIGHFEVRGIEAAW